MLIPLLGNNKVRNVFFDNESLLNKGLNSLHDLYGLYIVYSIIIGVIEYIGSTSDFGSRISTHIKNGRSLSSRLYNDMRNSTDNKIFRILEICQSESEMVEKEVEIIRNKRKEIINTHIGEEKWFLSEQKIDRIVKKYLFNLNSTK